MPQRPAPEHELYCQDAQLLIGSQHRKRAWRIQADQSVIPYTTTSVIRLQQEVEHQPSCEGSYYTVSGQVVGAIGYESYVEFVDTDTDDRGYPDRSPPGDYQFHEWAAIGSDGTFHLPYVPADIRVKARVGWQCAPVPWRCDYNPCGWVAVPDPLLDSYDGVSKSIGLNVPSSCEAGCAISNATPQCP